MSHDPAQPAVAPEDAKGGANGQPKAESDELRPLPGEAGIPDVNSARGLRWSRKAVTAAVLSVLAVAGLAGMGIQRLTSSSRPPGAGVPVKAADQPAAATVQPRRLEAIDQVAPSPSTASRPSPDPARGIPVAPVIPAITPTAEEAAAPIPLRGGTRGPGSAAMPANPLDAPILLVTAPTRAAGSRKQADVEDAGGTDTADPTDPMTEASRNLAQYQRQLQGMLNTMTQGAVPAGAPPTSTSTVAGGTPSGIAAGGIFGGQLQGSSAARVAASTLGNRSLTLPKGTAFTCTLKTRIISAASGLVGCQVQRHVYSDDGRVLLIERGSHLDGEYRIVSVRPGTVRIPVLWTRVRTPHGVTVDLASPATGPLGESGVEGHVDKRWGERLGAAMLLSLIDDAVKLAIEHQTEGGNGDTIVLPSTTDNSSKLAEKVLDSTINIPPLVYQNQGGLVGIYVARDIDFSSVYELQPVAR